MADAPVHVRDGPRTDAECVWLEGRRPRSVPSLRLFCFPYAGGSALVYRGWQDRFPAGIEVCPIQLPGRGRRLREPPWVEAGPLVQALVSALEPFLEVPFAIFGHSMGALLAFEFARALQARDGPEPVHLFVAGRRAPDLSDEDSPRYDLPDAEFRQSVKAMNGAPAAVFDDDELMRLMMPVLRADFQLVQQYQYEAGPRLRCPIRAFGGVADRSVTRANLQAWDRQTSAATRVSLLPGDHFFIQAAGHQLHDRLTADLRDWIA